MWSNNGGIKKHVAAIAIRNKFNTELSLVSHVKIVKGNQPKHCLTLS